MCWVGEEAGRRGLDIFTVDGDYKSGFHQREEERGELVSRIE